MKLSPYLRYAFRKLEQEGKYSFITLNRKNIKLYEPEDIWKKIIEFRELLQKQRAE